MTFYADLQATAGQLLTKYGQECTLTVITQGDYDPDTATNATTSTDYTVDAAVFDYPVRDIDGTLVRQGDKKVLVSAHGLAVRPLPSHTFTDAASNVYTVIEAKPTAPAGTVVLWTLQVRGAT